MTETVKSFEFKPKAKWKRKKPNGGEKLIILVAAAHKYRCNTNALQIIECSVEFVKYELAFITCDYRRDA